MSALLAWLRAFFFLGITGDEPPADEMPPAEGGDDETPPGDETPPDDELSLEGAGDDETPPDDDDGTAAAAEAAKALRTAEEKAARLEAELAAARGSRAAPMPTEESRILADEETRLRDPKTTELERWQINSNRTLRENKRASGMALFQAQDIADRTAFNQLAVTKPAIHKRYAERVEAEITKMRANNQNAPREAVLRYLIGNDAMEGKLSSKKGGSKAADTNTIDRGRSPGARSDVASKGRMTEAQKREKRLEGVQI